MNRQTNLFIMGASGRKNNLMVVMLIALLTTGIYLVNTNTYQPADTLESIEFDDQAILERAYEDVRNSMEFPTSQEEQIIKVFDEDNKLIESMTLLAGDDIIDEDFRKLINKSTLLTEYRGNKLYQLNR